MENKEVQMICEMAGAFLIDRLNPEFIVLFGSFARGIHHDRSDVDLAFYAPNSNFSVYDIFLLAQELEELLGRKVDLIDIEMVSTVFKAQIFGYGMPIFVKDGNELDRYRMNALSMYTVLNEDRKVILKQIHESGTIYGDGYSD